MRHVGTPKRRRGKFFCDFRGRAKPRPRKSHLQKKRRREFIADVGYLQDEGLIFSNNLSYTHRAIEGAFQSWSENLRRPHRTQKKIDFWRWGFAHRQKSIKGKAFA